MCLIPDFDGCLTWLQFDSLVAVAQREGGMAIVDAAEMAVRLRFRAVMMTAISFLAGLLPLMIATGARAASRRSVGPAVFGGMLAASVVGIFLIPSLYGVVQWLRERAYRFIGRGKAACRCVRPRNSPARRIAAGEAAA